LNTTDIAAVHSKEYDITDERIIIAQAPGRLNFMGEHCKYGSGQYLSMGINRVVNVALSARTDNTIKFFTAETNEHKRAAVSNIRYKREDRWANHIKMAICVFAEKNCNIRGMNWTISSSIPQNIGLAAARAIELAAALALRRFFNISINDNELIEHLSALQNEFFGKHDALADYLVMMNTRKDNLILVDEAHTGGVQKLKLPLSKYKIIIVDSKVPFIGVESELRARQADLEKGFELLCKKRPAQCFRDFIGSDLLDLMSALTEDARRRSMHVIKEHERIDEFCEALRTGDTPVMSRTIFHSHESLRDLYEVTCPELDWLVKRAQEIPGVLGARMAGKGFGGCVYALLPPDRVNEYLAKMDDYERIFGFHPVYFEVSPAAQARILK
jgi:galactokinase